MEYGRRAAAPRVTVPADDPGPHNEGQMTREEIARAVVNSIGPN